MPDIPLKQRSGQNNLFPVCILLLLLNLLVIVKLTLSLTSLVVELDASVPGMMEISWADTKGQFSSIKSTKTSLQTGHNVKVFMLWSFVKDVDKLNIRFDSTNNAQVSINNMVLLALGHVRIIYDKEQHFLKYFSLTTKNFQKSNVNKNGLTLVTEVGASAELTVNYDQQVTLLKTELYKHKAELCKDIALQIFDNFQDGVRKLVNKFDKFLSNLYKILFGLGVQKFVIIVIAAIVLFYNRSLYFALLILLANFGLVNVYIQSNAATISITMQSHLDVPFTPGDNLKIYWTDEAEVYSGHHLVRTKKNPELTLYKLPIESLNNVYSIRIEPLSLAGGIVDILDIKLTEPGYQPIIYNAKNHFYGIEPFKKNQTNNQFSKQALELRGDKLLFGSDDHFEFMELIVETNAFKIPYDYLFYLKIFGILIILLASCYYINLKLGRKRIQLLVFIARGGLIVISALIIQMAWQSTYDFHPDEKAHIDSLDYFTQYSEFPKVGDSRTIETYQYPWGVSRLDDLGISYFIMGKLKNVLLLFLDDSVFVCRALNTLLFLGLLLSTKTRRFALFSLPLLCFPQLWYLFSCTNRDAFALALSIALAWQFINPHSYLRRYLFANNFLSQAHYLLVPGVLLGVLSIEITNYLIFILYISACLVWQGLFIVGDKRNYFAKCLLLFALAGSIYGVRKVIDIEINGFDKQAQKTAFAEVVAGPEFKPSSIGTKAGYFGFHLQQRGVAAQDLFKPGWDWHNLVFKSFTGTYGHQYADYSPEWYYSLVKGLYGLIFLTIMYAVVRYGDLKLRLFSALTLVFMAGTLAMGFLYSWLYDFQPQGRYVFPLIPMLMLFCAQIRPLFTPRIQTILLANVIFLLMLSLYSFQQVALKYLVLN